MFAICSGCQPGSDKQADEKAVDYLDTPNNFWENLYFFHDLRIGDTSCLKDSCSNLSQRKKKKKKKGNLEICIQKMRIYCLLTKYDLVGFFNACGKCNARGKQDYMQLYLLVWLVGFCFVVQSREERASLLASILLQTILCSFHGR